MGSVIYDVPRGESVTQSIRVNPIARVVERKLEARLLCDMVTVLVCAYY